MDLRTLQLPKSEAQKVIAESGQSITSALRKQRYTDRTLPLTYHQEALFSDEQSKKLAIALHSFSQSDASQQAQWLCGTPFLRQLNNAHTGRRRNDSLHDALAYTFQCPVITLETNKPPKEQAAHVLEGLLRYKFRGNPTWRATDTYGRLVNLPPEHVTERLQAKRPECFYIQDTMVLLSIIDSQEVLHREVIFNYFVATPVLIKIDINAPHRTEQYDDKWGTTLRLHDVKVKMHLLDPANNSTVVYETLEAAREARDFLNERRTSFQRYCVTTSLEMHTATGELRLPRTM